MALNLTWYGHSAFRIETPKSRILIDPFFTGNPSFREEFFGLAIEDLTHIALTHGHADHVGDTVKISQETGATVISNYELGHWLGLQGVENLDFGNTGGTVRHSDFSVTWVQAFHSSSFLDDKGVCHHLGPPNGLVFHIDNEKTLYHMGDTDIFGDMSLIEELHKPDIGIVPVGDRFTMGGVVAALSCSRYFNFETVIPCHYGTFPIIDSSPASFVDAMTEHKSASSILVMKPGERVEL